MGKKRLASDQLSSAAKAHKTEEADYCDVEPVRDKDGVVWPATLDSIKAAQGFIQECAKSAERILIVPDKDADGLSSGAILRTTLILLGAREDDIEVYLIGKGSSVHDTHERVSMQARRPTHIIVCDQGSRSSPRLVDDASVKGLIIDHHLSDEFPEDTQVVTACRHPPVATSSLLTYEICKDLHEDVQKQCGWLCAIGTMGDLGSTLKWKPPFPDMKEVFGVYTKKAICDGVALLNARTLARRTARFDVITAWQALIAATTPKCLLMNKRLIAARAEIREEVERNTHAPPQFSKDGKIAVLRIHTPAQVHPVIATRWAGFLKSKTLEIVLVANTGYLEGLVNFSCRIAKCARGRDPPVNIIDSLKSAAILSDDDLITRLGTSFARGHKEASGGIVPCDAFEELMQLLKIGQKPDKPASSDSRAKTKPSSKTQSNNLMNYFIKK